MADRPKQVGGTLLCGLRCERQFEEAVLLVERGDGDGGEVVLLLQAAVIQEGHYFEVAAVVVVAACASDGRHQRGRQR